MGRLFQLLLRNGGFVTLIFVELFCFIVIVQYNTSQAAIWANTTDIFGGRILEKRQSVSDYFSLNERIDSLNHALDSLQTRLSNARLMQVPIRDTFFWVSYDSLSLNDSIRRKTIRPQYEFVTAKVVSNSITSANNWLIINRGSDDQVTPHMAVLSAKGVVGIIRHVSKNFSIAMSALHRQTRITAALQKQGTFGSLVWEGGDPHVMTLKDISKHFEDRIKVGDPVVTSGYSVMFPKDHPVGTVVDIPRPDPENPHFLVVKVLLSQDMSNINDVSIVRNLFASEIDSLKSQIKQ
jgi:rod shape-determining protein MreC